MFNLTLKMTRVLLVLIITWTSFGFSIQAQDTRIKLKEYLNKEIRIRDNFSGQSITLVKENREFYIIRKFFGSGVPVVSTIKYKVEFNSDYQIAFSEFVDISKSEGNDKFPKEEFILAVEENGLSLYLNKLKVVTY